MLVELQLRIRCLNLVAVATRTLTQEDHPARRTIIFAVLTGISVYVNVAAIVCAMVALPLFIGTKRQTRFDKNNLVGFVLLGVAVLLHGGFLTVLRSSPHAVFSGYVLGWSGGGEDTESSLWIMTWDSLRPTSQRSPTPSTETCT
jgi:hypothetical protein